MARYRVLEAKYGVGAGGMACGPIGGPVMAEIKLSDENSDVFYINLTEVDGIPNWFKTDRSTIDDEINEKSEEVFEYLNDHYIDIGEYGDVFADPEAELYQACRYLIYLVRCERGQENLSFGPLSGSFWTRWRSLCPMRKRNTGRKWKRTKKSNRFIVYWDLRFFVVWVWKTPPVWSMCSDGGVFHFHFLY